MTCKDCIHSGICAIQLEPHYVLDRTQKLMRESNNVEHECLSFKDRSRFVELPCKAGTTVYTVSLKHGVVPWGVYAICSTVTEWDAAPKITLLAHSKKIDKSTKFSANAVSTSVFFTREEAVSTSVFFTREEAEAALKEREEND